MGNFLRKLKSSPLQAAPALRVFPLLIAGTFLFACPHTAFSQAEPADSLSATFLRYSSRWLQEKLFVHVDKSFYLAGEIIWFKAYDVDARSNTPLILSGIAYVEVLDNEQKPILQEKIALNKGTGEGSFRIPYTASSGHYTFRAYTSWMKNFSPDFYFQQELTILNTLNNEPPADTAHNEGYTIRFFPEGGNLVSGLPSVVAFKTVDRSGNGIACRGMIIDQKKDTITRFTTGHFGMGHFTFTPIQGNTYYAVVTAGAPTYGTTTATPANGAAAGAQQLPTAFDDGIVMHLDDIDAHRLRITVRSASTPADPTVYLFVHTHQRIRSIQTARLTGNETVFTVDKDSLDDGISHLTVFNSQRAPLCERLYCKPPGRRLNIDVNTAGPACTTRQKIPVSLSTTGPSGQATPADLSLSVFLIDTLQSIPADNILSYLMLRSDLKGKIESPQFYFANTDPETTGALDDLMLTQGWTRFRWEDILRNKTPVFDFLPEPDGPVIHAKLTDKHSGLPPSPTIGYLSVPGRHFKLSTTLSREDGRLFFHVDRFYGNNQVIIQTNSLTDSNYRIDVSNPFSDRFSMQPDSAPLPSSLWKTQLLNRSIGVQAENAYRADLKNKILPHADKDSTGFYGLADRRYNLDEYTRFVTMNEVIREFVDNLKVRSQSGKATFRVRNVLFNLFFEDDPLLLIDGVPVFNGDKIIALNPLKIEKIDVVSHRYFLGPSITDGIVSFRSYEGDLGGYQLDPNAVVVQYNGLQENREFYTPVYETPAQIQSPLPDLRNQLLWYPEVTTDTAGKKQLSIYTSDLTGNFALVVQGLTSDGLMGYSIKTFTVNNAQ